MLMFEKAWIQGSVIVTGHSSMDTWLQRYIIPILHHTEVADI